MSARRLIPFLVLAAIVALVLLPAREQLWPASEPELAPVPFGPVPSRPAVDVAETFPREASPRVRTLVLYDRTGRWGWLGELYAVEAANLVSHFGAWHAKPAGEYTAGDLSRYSALVYVGSTYDEPLPGALLDDVLASTRPVVWVGDNVWRLATRAGDFGRRYGWAPTGLDRSQVATVEYKGRALTRWPHGSNGITQARIENPHAAHVLARAVRPDGSRFPWAVRSGSLTYVAEVPFAYASETDRVLVFADLLFDALAPQTKERHRALVRLEDVNPRTDPADLRATADYLHDEGIPFGFGVSPLYRDPQGREDSPYELRLRDAPELVAALRYLERKGGVLVGHGYTHQWDGASNPYNGVTGDDVEFFRVKVDSEGEIDPVGAIPGDTSPAWAERRLAAAEREFVAAGLDPPAIFEFPHYFASDTAYRAAARRYAVRWERCTYFSGVLRGHPIRYDRSVGQFFPYVVRDVYGSKVLPENLGSLAPNAWHTYEARHPLDLIRAARANLVVRDGFAAFYFHTFLPLELLKRTVKGIRAAGYEFVSPPSL